MGSGVLILQLEMPGSAMLSFLVQMKQEILLKVMVWRYTLEPLIVELQSTQVVDYGQKSNAPLQLKEALLQLKEESLLNIKRYVELKFLKVVGKLAL
jgi:hypothetical protein